MSLAFLAVDNVTIDREARPGRANLGDCDGACTGEIMATSNAPAGKAAPKGFLDNYFKLTEHGTNVRTEAIAGLTIVVAAGLYTLHREQVRRRKDAQVTPQSR